MTFINNRPVDGSTNPQTNPQANPQNILLDPEHVLSVFTTNDVSAMYEAIMEDEDHGFPAGQPSNFGELPQVVRLSLVEAAQRVFQDVNGQHDALMDAVRKVLSERFCFHCGGTLDYNWPCGWCEGILCSQCMKNRLTFGHPCPHD